MPAERNLFAVILERIKKSLLYTPKSSTFGEFKGVDYMGNKYYELPPDPRVGRRLSSRWYESNKKDLLLEVPPEWESWLRRRRNDPPTTEEIERNQKMMKMKKINAAKLDGKEYIEETAKTRYWGTAKGKFPRYEEYERYPGEDQK